LRIFITSVKENRRQVDLIAPAAGLRLPACCLENKTAAIAPTFCPLFVIAGKLHGAG
jgi:hypothetical protein